MTIDAGDRFSGYPFGDYVEPPGPDHARASSWDEAAPTSGRFNVVKFLALPGKCAVCGYSGGQDDTHAAYERNFIDFGFTVDYYGVVGFCTACVSEMANTIGFIGRDKYENYVAENSTLKAQLQEAQIVNTQLRGTINVLSSPTNSNSGVAVTADVKLVPVGNYKITESEQLPDESTDESGPNDVPSTTSNNDDGTLSI